MTRLEVGGVAVDNLPINTKVIRIRNEGSASRTVIIIITDPLLDDFEPSKPRRGSAYGLPSGVKSVGIGRRILCDRAEIRYSTVVHRQTGSSIRMG